MRIARGWRLGALTTGALCLTAALLAAPGVARAEDEAGQGLKEKIRQQMERVRELMRKNEEALLELSTGKDARPRDVDVTLPPPEGGSSGSSGLSGSSGTAGTGGAEGAGSAEATVRQLEELLGGSASGGSGDGMIPDELKRLVQMVPL